MTQDEQENPEQAVRVAARAFLSQSRWRLLSEAELAFRASALLGDDRSSNPGWAVLHVYAEALYGACASLEGPARQEAAYAELFGYLYAASFRFAPELSPDEREEVANQTVAEIFYRLAERHGLQPPAGVRDPGAFLAVATQQLRNVVRKWRRDVVLPWDEVAGEHELAAGGDLAQEAVDRDFRLRVRQCFERCLRRYPRARFQLWVVWMKEIDGLDYQAIGMALSMTVANVRVRHSRGLDRLRDDPEWRNLGREAGLLTAEAPSDDILQTQ